MGRFRAHLVAATPSEQHPLQRRACSGLTGGEEVVQTLRDRRTGDYSPILLLSNRRALDPPNKARQIARKAGLLSYCSLLTGKGQVCSEADDGVKRARCCEKVCGSVRRVWGCGAPVRARHDSGQRAWSVERPERPSARGRRVVTRL